MKQQAILVLAVVAALSACSEPSPTSQQTSSQGASSDGATAAPAAAAPAVDPKSKISPYVFEPYDKASFPKLAAQLGEAWSRLQATREAAALNVASNPRCDYVELAEAASRSTKTEIIVFVDCRNGERMYVGESDLKTGGATTFQSQKTIDRGTAIQACSNAAKSMTTHPELADMHTWAGAAFSANKTTGNGQVFLDFEASNAFGVEGKFTARCIFPASGAAPEITISPRS